MYHPLKKGANCMKETLLKGAKRCWQSPWIAGQLVIWIFILCLSFLAALFIHYTSIHSSSLYTIALMINGVSLISGGYIAGKKAGNKGWYYGGLQGIVYTLLVLLIGFLAYDSILKTSPFNFVISAFGISALGGIIGVNMRKE
jgi:putative membrane protein (TIGR04086 family)